MRTIHVQQASQRFTMTDPAKVRDQLADIAGHDADVTGLTEIRNIREHVSRFCRDQHLGAFLPELADVGLIWNRQHRVLDHFVVEAVPREPGPASEGGHGPRPVIGATLDVYGETVTFLVAHWPTKASDPTSRQRVRLTDTMGELIADHARGHHLAVWMGDTNNPDRSAEISPVDKALAEHHMLSVWDELGRWPDTEAGPGSHTIDVIGTYDPDRRVSVTRARTWHYLHSDHKEVSAWLAIKATAG